MTRALVQPLTVRCAVCRKVFHAIHRTKGRDEFICSGRCSRSYPEPPPLDPRQAERIRRNCKEMIAEGYDKLHIIERFGELLYSELLQSMSEAERNKSFECRYNLPRELRKKMGRTGEGWRSTGLPSLGKRVNHEQA